MKSVPGESEKMDCIYKAVFAVFLLLVITDGVMASSREIVSYLQLLTYDLLSSLKNFKVLINPLHYFIFN